VPAAPSQQANACGASIGLGCWSGLPRASHPPCPPAKQSGRAQLLRRRAGSGAADGPSGAPAAAPRAAAPLGAPAVDAAAARADDPSGSDGDTAPATTPDPVAPRARARPVNGTTDLSAASPAVAAGPDAAAAGPDAAAPSPYAAAGAGDGAASGVTGDSYQSYDGGAGAGGVTVLSAP